MTDTNFHAVVKKALDGYPRRAFILRRAFGVSKPIVERWTSGTDAPHPELQKPVLDFIAQQWP